MSKQPEALRLADALTPPTLPESTTTIPAQWNPQPRDRWEAADELRRQHALIEELRRALTMMLVGSQKDCGVISMPRNAAVVAAFEALAKAEAQ